MTVKTPVDDLLPDEIGEALGRLLIDYQELEACIESVMDLAFAPVDPLGLILAWSKELRVTGKIQKAKGILKIATEKYGVAEVEFAGSYPIRVDDKRAREQVAQSFAGMRRMLDRDSELLKYRNDLFHGTVTVEESAVRFTGGKGAALMATGAADFRQKAQEVRLATMYTALATGSVHVAFAYLIQAPSLSDATE